MWSPCIAFSPSDMLTDVDVGPRSDNFQIWLGSTRFWSHPAASVLRSPNLVHFRLFSAHKGSVSANFGKTPLDVGPSSTNAGVM